MQTYDNEVVDLFAGPGGWSLACQRLGLDEIGVEFEKNAVATREAAGFKSILGSVTDFGPAMFPKARGLIASPPCFAAGTPVLTKRGSVSIEDVQVGDEVWTHMNRWRPVTATMSRESELVQVGPITTTPDHPFYSRGVGREWRNDIRRYRRTLGAPDWTPANDLRGRFLATPLAVDIHSDEVWPVNPWLAGRYVADGWVGRDGISIAVGHGKEAQFERMSGEEWVTTQSGPSCLRYTTAHHRGARWLEEHFGKGAHSKTLPTFLLSEPAMVRLAFLAGYLAGDGTRTKSGWVASTVSTHLASQLRLLAIGLGFTANVVRVNTAPTKIIEGREVQQSAYWSVSVNDNDNRYTVDEFGHRWFKQRKAIKPAGFGAVYDITVEEDHSFTAWGYVVHNCQTFSMAGKGAGRKALDDVLRGIDDLANREQVIWERFTDERTGLVLEPLRWILQAADLGLVYRWVALEQVPTVQPVWDAYAEALLSEGYSVATGRLQAEQYGVPQTRKRSILIASLDHEVALPTPTHSRYYSRNPEKLDPGVEKWVSMAEALGWGNSDVTSVRSNYGSGGDPANRGERLITEPAFAVTSKVDRNKWVLGSPSGITGPCVRPTDHPAATVTGAGNYYLFTPEEWERRNGGRWNSRPVEDQPADDGADTARPYHRPATTIVGSFKPEVVAAPGYRTTVSRQNAKGSVKVTQQEAAILQSFPHDFPWQGSKSKRYQQIGNACPPLLAEHILQSVMRIHDNAG